MSKRINNMRELIDVCRRAGLWYVGSFMSEFLDNRKMWADPKTKGKFIAYMYREYGSNDSDISGTRTRVNCIIRIIESDKVVEALELVLNASDDKIGCPDSKINARETLDEIKQGKYCF